MAGRLPSGQLTSLWSPDGEQLSFAYDAGGRLLERRFGNGAGSRFSWNADGSLARRQNLASATTLVSQHDYAYDGLGRLSEARNGVSGALLGGYSYDLLGNRLSRSTVSATDAYVYDGSATQLLEVHANTPTVALTRALVRDANGQRALSSAELR